MTGLANASRRLDNSHRRYHLNHAPAVPSRGRDGPVGGAASGGLGRCSSSLIASDRPHEIPRCRLLIPSPPHPAPCSLLISCLRDLWISQLPSALSTSTLLLILSLACPSCQDPKDTKTRSRLHFPNRRTITHATGIGSRSEKAVAKTPPRNRRVVPIP